MIKPEELESGAGQLTWDTIVAAAEDDVMALRRLIERNSRLALSEYWYTPAIHFAVREGHIESVQLLLDGGAHPEWNGLHNGSLIQMANERGYTEIARLLEQTRDRRGTIRAQTADYPIHAAAARGARAKSAGCSMQIPACSILVMPRELHRSIGPFAEARTRR